MKNLHIGIIGGGASGISAAITAARLGARVTILEKNDILGKKILATGNGRCNMTNINISPACYNNPVFVESVLRQHGCTDIRSFFDNMGLLSYSDEQGRVYPVTDAAASVNDVLRLECGRLKIDVKYKFEVCKIEHIGDGFLIKSTAGERLTCDKIISAAGGRNELLCSLGHKRVPFCPVLCPIKTDTSDIKGLSGIRVKCEGSLFDKKHLIFKERGELLFRDYGVSGVMIFNISRYAASGMELSIDLMPDISHKDLTVLLNKRKTLLSYRNSDDFFVGMLNRKLGQAIIKYSASMDAPVLAHSIKNLRLRITGSGDEKQAQVTRGGLDVRQFNRQTMESKLVKGIYAAGETLDIDGMCGGFNLHWAFSSGITAAENAAKHE